MTFSKRLRNLIDERELTQADIAKYAKCSPASISRYLNDDSSDPPLSTIVNLATSLGVSIDYLVGRTSIKEPRSYSEEFGYVLYQCYARATPRDQQLVSTVLNPYLTEDEVSMNYSLL